MVFLNRHLRASSNLYAACTLWWRIAASTTKENVKIIDEENYEMKSTKKKPPSKKVLFEAVSLTENFALVRKNDLAKQLRKHTA